ncbi:hypothetical protein F5Y10DRAFT_284547 [Nemania abortiva]|nr:hypothetical protein F5Y10DRAFT_284547 [Nemania abortiva]
MELTTQEKRTKKPKPLIDLELHRLIAEWRVSRTREDYKPYSEQELRRFGELWKVGELPQKPRYALSTEEIHEGLRELEALHKTLSKITDKFYELAWTRRRSPAYWNHLWLTFHLAGATVEEVWDIIRNRWPILVKEMESFSSNEVEKLWEFVETSNNILVQCDSILADFDFEREDAYCLKLYKTLRTFPIAPRWKRIVSWGTQDKFMRRQGSNVVSWIVGWF